MSASSKDGATGSLFTGTPAATATRGLKKVVAASMVGTVVEWYEFFLYATAASLIFGKYFFPNSASPLDGIIAAFLTYAVGFIARPLVASSSVRSETVWAANTPCRRPSFWSASRPS